MNTSSPTLAWRGALRWMRVCALLASVLSALPCVARPVHLFKIASLAPEGSAWVQAVAAIDDEIRAQTDDEVGLKVYAGGVQGDDPVVLRKIRIGQLQGAGFAGPGLSTICPDVRALEVPFLFHDYGEIDCVLEEMETYYQDRIAEAGYVLLGWFDLGFVHLLSNMPVRDVADMTGRKVWRLEDEPLTQVLFRKAGVTSVPLTIPDVLLGLQTRMVDVVYAPPAAAIALQWFTRVKYITRLPINYTVGALLLAAHPFAQLSPQQQSLLRQTGRRHMQALTHQMRADNEEALRVMQNNGLQWVTPDPEAVRSFHRLVEESIPEWLDTSFSSTAYEQIRAQLHLCRTAAESARP